MIALSVLVGTLGIALTGAGSSPATEPRHRNPKIATVECSGDLEADACGVLPSGWTFALLASTQDTGEFLVVDLGGAVPPDSDVANQWMRRVPIELRKSFEIVVLRPPEEAPAGVLCPTRNPLAQSWFSAGSELELAAALAECRGGARTPRTFDELSGDLLWIAEHDADRSVSLLGYSIGASEFMSHASLHPQRVDRVVADSSIDFVSHWKTRSEIAGTRLESLWDEYVSHCTENQPRLSENQFVDCSHELIAAGPEIGAEQIALAQILLEASSNDVWHRVSFAISDNNYLAKTVKLRQTDNLNLFAVLRTRECSLNRSNPAVADLRRDGSSSPDGLRALALNLEATVCTGTVAAAPITTADAPIGNRTLILRYADDPVGWDPVEVWPAVSGASDVVLAGSDHIIFMSGKNACVDEVVIAFLGGAMSGNENAGQRHCSR